MFTFEDAMRPILAALAERPEMQAKEIADAVADHFGLSQDERAQVLPSGMQATYRNRAGWGMTNLHKAQLI